MANFSRLSGLMSGLDTDTLVQKMLKTEYAKVDKLKQKQIYETWRQDAYRDVSSMLLGFKSKYMDILNPDTNLKFTKNLEVNSPVVKIDGKNSNIVGVKVLNSSDIKNFKIDAISQLATKDTINSMGRAKKSVGFEAVKEDGLKDLVSKSKGLTFNIDGVEKKIYLTGDNLKDDGSVDNTEEIAKELSKKLSDATGFNTTKDLVTKNADGKLEFNFDGHKIFYVAKGIETEDETAKLEDALGLVKKVEIGDNKYRIDVMGNQFDKKRTLKELGLTADSTKNGKIELEINGYKFSNINENDTIDSTINKINSSSAGVNIIYDDVSGSFKMQSKKEGSLNAINMNLAADSDNAKFMKILNMPSNETEYENNRTKPLNAIFKIDGVEIERPENTTVINGVEISLNSIYNATKTGNQITYGNDKPISVEFEKDYKPAVKLIKEFAEKYNELVDKMSKLTNERKVIKYQPLTDEMKKEMKEDDIKAWENKAKQGILRNDDIIDGVLSKMRQAFLSKMEGSGVSLHDIGIEFSNNYKDNGKIVINEQKLTNAFKENLGEVQKWFSSVSDTPYGKLDSNGKYDVEAAKKRFSENGIIQRLQDIIDDATRISSIGGKKGSLIEKAGIRGTSSNTANDISKLIKSYDDKIDQMMEKIYRKEDRYYKKFAQLETLLAKAQKQQSAFMQQS